MAIITGDEKANRLKGKGENDFIYGLGGNDQLFGFAGDDKLYGGDGADALFGDIGYDYLDGGTGDDMLDGGVGSDGLVNIIHDPARGIVSWSFGVNSILGGLLGYAGADRIFGGDGNDVGLGGYDRDRLFGEVGDDVLFGGADVDEINGGVGNDVLVGDSLPTVNFSDATIVGGLGGDDIIDGESGDDLIYGGAGGDTITGGTGIDFIFGGYSNDSNTAAGFIDGVDDISGLEGNDVLRGAEGNDMLKGGEDDDNLRGDLGNDTLDGGDGDDLASYRFDDIGLTAGATFSAAALVPGEGAISINDGRGGVDLLIGIERIQVIGSAYGDTFEGGGGGDFLFGNGGDDALTGGDGADMVDGGAGNDTLIADLGDDEMLGGEGADIVHYRFDLMNLARGVTFDASAFTGVARVLVTGDLTGSDWLEGVEAIALTGTEFNDNFLGSAIGDFIRGEGGADRIRARGGRDEVFGGLGIDQLFGEDGDDTLSGDEDNDILTGGIGDDVLDGGTGADTMSGGGDNDFYRIDDAGDLVIEEKNQGTDQISAKVSYTLPDNVDTLTLEDAESAVEGHGNALDNAINGNDFNNSLSGGAGNDAISANGGADSLDGGKGHDDMSGGTGDDTYKVDNVGDVVEEAMDSGVDTVFSSISFELPENIESLFLEGRKALTGTGNDLDNVITGNRLDNVLSGGDGDDILVGGEGADILVGGAGRDTIRIDLAQESTSSAFDTVRFGGSIYDLVFDLDVVPPDFATVIGGQLRSNRFDQDLQEAIGADELHAGSAAVFYPSRGDYLGTGNFFLIVDANGVDGYQAGLDYVIRVEGMSGSPDITFI